MMVAREIGGRGYAGGTRTLIQTRVFAFLSQAQEACWKRSTRSNDVGNSEELPFLRIGCVPGCGFMAFVGWH